MNAVSSLDLAQKALALNTQTGASIPQIIGKRVEHWSYKFIAAGAIIGVVIAIAAFIFGHIPAGVVGLILFGTNAIATFYLHRFANFNQLDDYVRQLALKVQDFHKENMDLKQTTKDLDANIKHLEEVPHDWKVEVEKGREEFEVMKKELEGLRAKYEIVVKQLLKFSKIAKNLQLQAGTLGQNADKMKEEEDKFENDEELLGKLVDGIRGEDDDLERESKKLEDVVAELDRIDQDFDKAEKTIKDNLTKTKEIYDKMEGLVDALTKKYKEDLVLMGDLHERAQVADELRSLNEEQEAFINTCRPAYEQWKAREINT